MSERARQKSCRLRERFVNAKIRINKPKSMSTDLPRTGHYYSKTLRESQFRKEVSEAYFSGRATPNMTDMF